MANKINSSAMEEQMIKMMTSSLSSIYGNKSSDEYKSKGDITASIEYKNIEKMVSDLRYIKKYPEVEAKDIKQLFATLHKPVFKEMVTQYIMEPNERNIMFTSIYTVGFRVLVGELARIYSSTEATEEGIIYKPDKIAKRENVIPFIRSYNANIDKRIDDYIKSKTSEVDAVPVQEAAAELSSTMIAGVSQVTTKISKIVSKLFSSLRGVNPVSFMNAVLSRSYQEKVDNYTKIADLYKATKDAFDDYMKIPESSRVKRVESKYIKLLDKYNIKMQNAKAAIEHYDQRSIIESQEKEPTPAPSSPKKNTNSDDTSKQDDKNDDIDF